MKTTLELALIRWAVVCRKWNEIANGEMPQIGPFLSGWFLRDMGVPLPGELGTFTNSFRVGYREADEQITILERAALR